MSGVHPGPGFQDLLWVTGSPGQCMPYFCGMLYTPYAMYPSMLCTLVCYVSLSATLCVWYGHPSLPPSSPGLVSEWHVVISSGIPFLVSPECSEESAGGIGTQYNLSALSFLTTVSI